MNLQLFWANRYPFLAGKVGARHLRRHRTLGNVRFFFRRVFQRDKNSGNRLTIQHVKSKGRTRVTRRLTSLCRDADLLLANGARRRLNKHRTVVPRVTLLTKTPRRVLANLRILSLISSVNRRH